MDGLFNTSKSNKHLWEQISSKMREKGFDRSPTMCTDKWRNLLKEFKKAKHHDRGNGSAKMSYYKEIEDILRERSKKVTPPQYNKSPNTPPTSAKVDSFMQFTDKGINFGINCRFLDLDSENVTVIMVFVATIWENSYLYLRLRRYYILE